MVGWKNHKRRPDHAVTELYRRRRERDGGTAFGGAYVVKARAVVFARDGCCQWCGSLERLELDHIIERRQEPDHSYTNLQALCHRCHAAKTLAYSEALADLRAQHPDDFQVLLDARYESAKRVISADNTDIPAPVQQLDLFAG